MIETIASETMVGAVAAALHDVTDAILGMTLGERVVIIFKPHGLQIERQKSLFAQSPTVGDLILMIDESDDLLRDLADEIERQQEARHGKG